MNILKRFFQRERDLPDGPLQLNLPSPPPRPPQRQKPQPPAERVPGNFFTFTFILDIEISGVVHAGLPKLALRNSITGQVRWGESLSNLRPDPNRPRISWIDDPVRGVNQRTLENPEDVLGAEGTLGGKRIRFERILDLGRNVVVYALFCPDQNFRIAYGWNREVFQPGYVPAPQRLHPLPKTGSQND